MARTQSPDYDDRRELILERAIKLYAERGFFGASVADIAKACKISKSLIYHYFPAKEDILFEAMDSHLKVLIDAVAGVLAMEVAPPEKLRALAHALLHLYAGAAARHKVLINELARLSRSRRDQITARQKKLVHMVADLLMEIQPKGSAVPALKTATAMLFFGMVNWTHTWFDPAGPSSVDAVADLTADIMLNGIKAPRVRK